MALKKLSANNNEVDRSDDKGKINEIVKNLFKFRKFKTTKFENLIPINAI